MNERRGSVYTAFVGYLTMAEEWFSATSARSGTTRFVLTFPKCTLRIAAVRNGTVVDASDILL